ncbi:MAG: DNA polymerase V [Pantoea sp.]|uniref:DNA polymerase V n=1 Tax=Pantoea septica TaxID=472695 RepID=A0ABX3UUJ4_9GAMM|nr:MULTISPECIES: DNA polymerase V [Pantoea]MDU5780395.1 DNA polymerase V [Pantoea sp.]ORN01613.1 DNA polymerase V [Pantoea septica]
MPREYEKETAFRNAIKRDQQGRYTVTTVDFVTELERLNWHLTLKEANRWVEIYTSTFRDVSTKEGEERTFQVFNPNGGI